MLSASLIVIVIAVLVGCTSTPIQPAEQTNPPGTDTGQTAVEQSRTEASSLTESAAASITQAAMSIEPEFTLAPTAQPNAGELLWTFKPGLANEPPLWVSPLTSATAFNGIVYVGASDVAGGKRGSLHALDAIDGSLFWSYDHNGHTPSTPTVADGVVYFGSEDHNIYAVDAMEGNLLWTYTTDGHVRSVPAVDDDEVFVNSQDGYLYALDVTSGELHWQFQFDEPVSDIASFGTVRSSPAVDDGAVFIVGSDHILRAINVLDGTLRWEYDISGEVFGSPRAIDGMVYVGSLNRNLYALNSEDGDLLWSYRAEGTISSTPVVEDGKVYVGSSILFAIDASTGMILWEYDPQILGTLGSPAIESEYLYVTGFNGQLYALDKNDGTLLALFDLGEEIGKKPPAVKNGIMYVVTKDRFLYAVKMID
jgi:outer membrane protein assembly factor BamB